MELERPHRTSSTPTTTSELFICFTSRLSKSSSMRLSSKSILSPSHNPDSKASQNHTLSTSLSRRLRHNGSLRGAQSPAMFPSKKSAANRASSSTSGFAENPEPSSPKVTCIGQVRVKTKKQGKKMKMRACRTSKRLSGGGSGGEASFRRIESGAQEGCQSQNQQQQQQQASSQQECEMNHRNQRWVHLPITICEALRAFGSEFSCLFPCKSSCFSSGLCGNNGGNNNVKREERENSASSSSCAVFRWLVSLQEGEEEEGGGEKRRDIELVVGGDDVEERERRVVMMERECSRRRSIFDDMEFDDLFKDLGKNDNSNGKIMNNDEEDEEEVEEGRRRSLCVPPKNALLLMRCRSDPMKMASLSRKFWDPPLPPQQVLDDDARLGEVGVEEERENVAEEVKKVEQEVEVEVELEEEETEEIEDETEKIEDEIEEKIETLGDLNEEMGEMLDDDDMGEAKIETLADFVAVEDEEEEFQEVEDEQEKLETEEKQSIEEIQEEEKCEVSEETHFAEDETQVKEAEDETQLKEAEITANRSSIEEVSVEEKVESEVEDVENEAELVTNSEENHEVNKEEKNEKDKDESSYISTTANSMSSNSTLNSSDESTAESKEAEFREKEETTIVEVEQERRKSVEEESNNLIVSKIDEKTNNNNNNNNSNNKPPKLPDCLLLMMCEPKLSMEVSKETWVCSTDFIRWLPERHHNKKANPTNKTDGSDESTVAKTKKKPAAVGPPVQTVQPARSSISFPAGPVANMIEQKLVKAGGYEPLILTRCKSAPMRSTAKIEPHRPATFGVGKAGVGF